MEQIYHYILNNSLINETTYLVADGATYDCTPSNVYGPTYNSGVMIGAMVELCKISSDPSYTDLAFKMAMGVIERSCDAEGILVESCTATCDEVPITKCNISYQDGPPYFNKSGPVFSPDWRGPFSYGDTMQQTSVLDLFISAIQPSTECSGSFCNYDPPNPPPQPLTCNSKPCPEREDCCEYSPYTSYTCCYTNQHCNNTTGVCDNN
ncbi:hypothetical protein DPMN_106862 [Dreissena polymorpha]|uniref:Uncharacterized protein n=1 Tax=Dreissena polymorpha TaxID=45954 RepID=A0A9D4QJH1_DREPO|nr:hypothetical protein DPMN_106862 [Dreissena polymorpha]